MCDRKGLAIHSGVAIRERTVIGERVVIYNNVVIGCDGFGYAKDEERHWLKIPQTGRVVLEDDVEIGAGTTIDRSSVGETRIGRGTRSTTWSRSGIHAPLAKIHCCARKLDWRAARISAVAWCWPDRRVSPGI